MSRPIQVANVQAFWGDYSQAPVDMLRLAPDINYLTLDYLAEVSMSILAKQRSRDPKLGFARDYIKVVESLAPYWAQGSTVKVISNAGGLSPYNCALQCAEVLRQADCSGRRIGVVTGDSVLPQLQQSPGDDPLFRNLDSGESLQRRRDELITANAYVGARPIVEALRAGADMVITGRVADPSLAVAPCVFEHDWSWQAYDQLAGATVAGHLIECGTQVTGGISTHWLDIADPDRIGYPIVEIDDQGNCLVTKPTGTSGRVDLKTVKEQLLYELGDPGNYLSPDVSVSFLSLELEDHGNDRVQVHGAKGTAPPPTLKVSATYQAGFHASGTLVIFGEDAVRKARRCGELVLKRLADHGLTPAETRIECLGAGAVAPLQELPNQNLVEVVLRVSVADSRREIIQHFADNWMSLVCCGPQGTTGYAGGRPQVHETYAYWPCLIKSTDVATRAEIIEV